MKPAIAIATVLTLLCSPTFAAESKERLLNDSSRITDANTTKGVVVTEEMTEI